MLGLSKPTRINKARQYGYKAKQGIIVVRVRLRRGPFNRRRPNSGRRPKRMGVYGITTSKSLQLIAEERAARKHPNMEFSVRTGLVRMGPMYGMKSS